MSEPSADGRFGTWFASHRVRSYFMVACYVLVLVAGLVGLVMPSQSATDALPDRVLVILWTLLYCATAPVAAVARIKRAYSVELLALALIMGGTALHALFLLDQGESGLQTGFRLVAGLPVLAAVGSMLHELARTQRAGNLVVDPADLERRITAEAQALAARRRDEEETTGDDT